MQYFKCSVCNISIPVIYKGRNPPFLPGVQYKEDVYIMEEQSGDTMPIPIGGVCCVCNEPCCLQESCSVVCNGNKRYCNHHKPLFYVSFILFAFEQFAIVESNGLLCSWRTQYNE